MTYYLVITFLLGLCIGSFLNVVIHRLPKMMEQGWAAECADFLGVAPAQPEPGKNRRGATRKRASPAYTQRWQELSAAAPPAFNLAVPRSRCPHCGHEITPAENIPILSWLILRGKCSACRAPISPRYPVVELTTGVLFAFCAWHFGPTVEAAAAMLFSAAMIALTMIDFDTTLLPDDITLPLLWAGLLLNISGTFAPLPDAVVGAAAGYLSLWLVYWAFKLLTGKEGMGYGDFKLLAAIGAWLGWQLLPMVILLSSVVGAVVGISLIVLARLGWDKPIPFGPYLAAAGLIALFWGDQINQTYLQTFK